MNAGLVPDLVYLPELPARGVGADLIGRTASLLPGMSVDLQPSGWRVVPRPGHDAQRARALLNRDLDALEIAMFGFSGVVKVQLAGPWTLAATLYSHRGDRLLADRGARSDIAASLAEATAEHVADVSRRLPEATVVVQIDEPSLPAVLRGSIPTASGLTRLRAVSSTEVVHGLETVLAAAGQDPVVHCCAGEVPIELVQRAGARALSFDWRLMAGDTHLDTFAAAVDAGMSLWTGVVATTAPRLPFNEVAAATDLLGWWRRMGYGPTEASLSCVVTPTCGLAAADPEWARTSLRHSVEVAKRLQG